MIAIPSGPVRALFVPCDEIRPCAVEQCQLDAVIWVSFPDLPGLDAEQSIPVCANHKPGR